MRLFVSVCAVALATGSAAALAQTPAPASPAPVAADDAAFATPPAGPGAAAPRAAGGDDAFATPPALDGAPAAAPGIGDATLNLEPRDKYESFNRAMWDLNQGVDRIAIKPVTKVYRFVTPRPVRRGIGNVFSNLSEPWSFINNLLQLKFKRAARNLGRFVVNTTIGVGGLADNATKIGIRSSDEDFGQTLAAWGVKSSAYLVLPLFGPSTVRDGIGTGVAFFADPVPICIQQCTNLNFIERTGIQAVRLVSARSGLIDSGADAFLASSLDPYASARSVYLQNRARAIADDNAGKTPASPGSVNTTSPPPATPADGAGGAAPADDPFATPPPVPAADPAAAEPSPAAARPDRAS